MTWNKRKMATEFRKRLDAEGFYTRDTSTDSRGPVMLWVTKFASTVGHVQVWTELSRFTLFDRNGYDEHHTADIDEIVSHLKELDW